MLLEVEVGAGVEEEASESALATAEVGVWMGVEEKANDPVIIVGGETEER